MANTAVKKAEVKNEVNSFIDMAFEMFSKLDLDMTYFQIMWESLMDKMYIECSDIDAFIDDINSVKAANEKKYFTFICKKYLTNKLPF